MNSSIATVTAYCLGLLVLVIAVVSSGCDACQGSTEEPPPWRFESETAPYEVIFPPEWSAEPPDQLNPYADVAAHRDNEFFFMIIPQELDSYPTPTVDDLRRSAFETLETSVADLTIERQGPLELDGVDGTTIFARGTIDDQPVAYITSYLIYEGYGYQIIAFTGGQRFGELFEEVDVILANWGFTNPSASTDAPQDQPTPSDSPAP